MCFFVLVCLDVGLCPHALFHRCCSFIHRGCLNGVGGGGGETGGVAFSLISRVRVRSVSFFFHFVLYLIMPFCYLFVVVVVVLSIRGLVHYFLRIFLEKQQRNAPLRVIYCLCRSLVYSTTRYNGCALGAGSWKRKQEKREEERKLLVLGGGGGGWGRGCVRVWGKGPNKRSARQSCVAIAGRCYTCLRETEWRRRHGRRRTILSAGRPDKKNKIRKASVIKEEEEENRRCKEMRCRNENKTNKRWGGGGRWGGERGEEWGGGGRVRRGKSALGLEESTRT